MVTIDTSGSGAVASGTEREHAPIMKANRWRWSRNLGAWYLPRTFRRATVDLYVERTTEALKAAGVDVEHIDGERDDDQSRAEQRLARDRELVDIHDRRAESARAAGQALHDEAHRMADAIPFGQPILVGHHSESRDRRYRDRIHSKQGKAYEQLNRADDEARKARETAGRVAAAERTARGGDFHHGDIEVGDFISRSASRDDWTPVLRVNAKTVSIPWFTGDTWRVPYLKIRRVAKDPENFTLVRADLHHYARNADPEAAGS